MGIRNWLGKPVRVITQRAYEQKESLTIPRDAQNVEVESLS